MCGCMSDDRDGCVCIHVLAHILDDIVRLREICAQRRLRVASARNITAPRTATCSPRRRSGHPVRRGSSEPPCCLELTFACASAAGHRGDALSEGASGRLSRRAVRMCVYCHTQQYAESNKRPSHPPREGEGGASSGLHCSGTASLCQQRITTAPAARHWRCGVAAGGPLGRQVVLYATPTEPRPPQMERHFRLVLC